MGYKFNRDIKMFFLGMHSTLLFIGLILHNINIVAFNAAALIFLFGAVKQLTVTGGE